jgi:hypothetical protein
MNADSADKWRVFISHTAKLRDFPRESSYVAQVERAISATGHVVVDMTDFRPPIPALGGSVLAQCWGFVGTKLPVTANIVAADPHRNIIALGLSDAIQFGSTDDAAAVAKTLRRPSASEDRVSVCPSGCRDHCVCSRTLVRPDALVADRG